MTKYSFILFLLFYCQFFFGYQSFFPNGIFFKLKLISEVSQNNLFLTVQFHEQFRVIHEKKRIFLDVYVTNLDYNKNNVLPKSGHVDPFQQHNKKDNLYKKPKKL